MSKRNRPLTSRWFRWRRYRYQSLLAQGMSTGVAWQLAKGEAQGRRNLAAIIGAKAAEDAPMICAEQHGKLRFFLTGPLDGLSDRQRTKLSARGPFEVASFGP